MEAGTQTKYIFLLCSISIRYYYYKTRSKTSLYLATRMGSKYRKKSHFTVGDTVLIRNYNKSRKFDSLFLQKAFKIIDINQEENKITVQQEGSGLTLTRHPDDIKLVKFRPDNTEDKQECVQHSDVQWPEDIENEDDDQRYSFGSGDAAPPLRRSQRKKTNVPVYI